MLNLSHENGEEESRAWRPTRRRTAHRFGSEGSFERADADAALGPVSDDGQAREREHDAELQGILNRRWLRGVTQHLVLWKAGAMPRRMANAWL